MNNPDLSVFPCMSKRHRIIARSHENLHILSEENIWETANDVWKELPNNKIHQVKYKCTNFPKQMYNGGNTFLVTGGSGINMEVIN